MSKAASKKKDDQTVDLTPLRKDVLLNVEGLEKSFMQGDENLAIFKDLNLKIESGEMVALVGESGSGKSTLLQILGLLDQPTKGRVLVDNQNTTELGDYDRTVLRRQYIGFVYQFHNLQPEFSALENVMLPQMIAGHSKKDAAERSEMLLTALGLESRVSHRPARLSGGEQQRVAIARALSNTPSLLLADEPTGNLDPETSEDVFDILMELVRSTGIGAIVATHNHDLADRMDRVLELKNGKLKPL